MCESGEGKRGEGEERGARGWDLSEILSSHKVLNCFLTTL